MVQIEAPAGWTPPTAHGKRAAAADGKPIASGKATENQLEKIRSEFVQKMQEHKKDIVEAIKSGARGIVWGPAGKIGSGVGKGVAGFFGFGGGGAE